MLKPSSTSSGKFHRVFVLGMRSSGKSSILNQVIFSRGPGCNQLLKAATVSTISPSLSAQPSKHLTTVNNGHSSHYQSTLNNTMTPVHVYSEEQNVEKCFIKDIYSALIVNEEKAIKERIHLCEVPIEASSATGQIELIKDFINSADGIILVYCIDSFESFQLIDMLKRSIDKSREKRDIPVVALGNKLDRFRDRKVDATACQAWAVKENVHLCEVTATERKSLIEPFMYLASRLNPTSQSKFDRFNKLSSKRSTSQMTMELWIISLAQWPLHSWNFISRWYAQVQLIIYHTTSCWHSTAQNILLPSSQCLSQLAKRNFPRLNTNSHKYSLRLPPVILYTRWTTYWFVPWFAYLARLLPVSGDSLSCEILSVRYRLRSIVIFQPRELTVTQGVSKRGKFYSERFPQLGGVISSIAKARQRWK